ncbi:MAG TPA: prepilin-type N-terminal cleavage/methylation domain-containing protein [Opitutus sp.]|nr:prepilin-type N-terminal cleavage/methylation domain-containing protein [Opitutus sp.]
MTPRLALRESPRCSAAARGYTLVELLVVVALIAGLAAFLFRGIGGSGGGASLQTGQALLTNLFIVARTKAVATGATTRVLVQVDPSIRDDFLRICAVQIARAGGWETVMETRLPEGIFVVPGNVPSLPAGMFDERDAAGWIKADGSTPLRSTALRAGAVVTAVVGAGTDAQWATVSFAAAGTTAQAGDIVLAPGRRRPPGTVSAGASPIVLEQPERVRGLALSTYGLVTLIDERASF